MKNVIIIILTTIGAILTVMAGHDIFLKNSPTWLTGIEGSSLMTIFIAGLVCLAIVLVILLVSANNHRLMASVSAPQKGQREYYGPGSDSFNGARKQSRHEQGFQPCSPTDMPQQDLRDTMFRLQ